MASDCSGRQVGSLKQGWPREGLGIPLEAAAGPTGNLFLLPFLGRLAAGGAGDGGTAGPPATPRLTLPCVSDSQLFREGDGVT